MLSKLFLVFLSLISIADCQYFCDKQYIDQLFDLVFNFDNFAYVFRGTDAWVLKYDNSTKQWQEDRTITRSNLFANLSDDVQINSILSISEYSACGISDVCDDPNDFNPTNVTFVLGGDKLLLYRRTDVAEFAPIVGNDSNVPWEVGYGTESTQELFPTLANETIEASLVRPPVGQDGPKVFVVTDKTINSFDLSQRVINRRPITKGSRPPEISNVTIIGWILKDWDTLAFGGNNVWSIKIAQPPKDKNISFWQFFSCDLFQWPTTPTIATTTTMMTETTKDETTPSSHSPTMSSTLATISTVGSLPNKPEQPPNQNPVSDKPVADKAQEETDQKPISQGFWILLFVCVIICAAIVTGFAVFGFNILTEELP